jgi:hypothetical protein
VFQKFTIMLSILSATISAAQGAPGEEARGEGIRERAEHEIPSAERYFPGDGTQGVPCRAQCALPSQMIPPPPRACPRSDEIATMRNYSEHENVDGATAAMPRRAAIRIWLVTSARAPVRYSTVRLHQSHSVVCYSRIRLSTS